MANREVIRTDAEIEAALERAKTHGSDPRAQTIEYIPALKLLIVGLSNGRRLALPIEDLQGLGSATHKQIQNYELLGRGLPYLADVSVYLNAEMDRGKRVLFEGAQGTLLDLDHGTYPFVTSSSSTAGGACTGTGVGPTRIDSVIGVSKAYATRVGSGPFPTEALGAEGEKIRERGGEYGAVTGRPRRCGWFDVPVARYSARINHLDALIITKLDILDPLPEIPVGVEYEYKGKRFKDFPPEIESLEQMKVHYRTVPGWQKHTYGAQELSQLPARAQDYLSFLADQVGVKVAMVSTGPEREQCVWLDKSVVAR